MTNTLQIADAHGWRSGFTNLLRAENGRWWKSRRWLVQSAVWLAMINGILALTLWTEPAGSRDSFEALELYTIFSAVFAVVGVAIIAQGAIVGEKREGTAAWILSKPASRSAVILAKFVGNLIGIVVILVLLQGAVAYMQISLAIGEYISAPQFLLGLGPITLNLIFYLTLSLMLGSVFNVRGPVIGITLAFVFLQQLAIGLFPVLYQIFPYALAIPDPGISIALALMLGEPLPAVWPLIVTPVWSLLFMVVALWRFGREEF